MTGDVIEVLTDSLAYGGSTSGKVVGGVEELIGMRCFLPHAAINERVRAQVVRRKRSFVEARLLEVLLPSPQRVVPPCPYFGTCGGCDLQHIAIETQREEKRRLVESTLAHQFRIAPRNGVKLVGGELPAFHYRRRVVLHLDTEGVLGFYRAGTGDVVEVAQCIIAMPAINEAIAALRPWGKRMAATVGAISLELNGGAVSLLLKPRAGSSIASALLTEMRSTFPHITTHDANDAQRLEPIGRFSQVNEHGNELLQSVVDAAVSGAPLTEFYAGAGNFSLLLARRGIHVVAVEVDSSLVAAGRRAAQELDLSERLTFEHASTEHYVRTRTLRGEILLDPPRSGADALCQSLSPHTTDRIVYVSCNVPSLGRDLKTLAQRGFIVESTAVIDMFPQTHHVETITVLTAPHTPSRPQ